MIIIPKKENKSSVKFEFKETLGYFPEKMASKPYMRAYHNHHEYRVIDNPEMGFKIKIKVGGVIGDIGKTIGKAFKDTTRFVSNTAEGFAKVVAEVAKPVMVVVDGVGEVAENVYREASKVATNVWRESSKFATAAYQEVGRPGFRIVRNIYNEVLWQPIAKSIDFAVVPLLPKSVREKVEKVLDVPDRAFRGKLRDKDIIAGVVATYQLAMIPTKVVGNFYNDTINTLKKDAILGPFLKAIDKYTGGLLTSTQSLATMSDDIYNNRSIDWKARIIDALKVYLATVTVSAMIKSASTSYIGDETGLNQTPLGRTVLYAGVAYAGTLKFSSLTEMANSATTDNLTGALKNAAIAEAKSEVCVEAVKKGWVDDRQTASLILSAGDKLTGTIGTDKTLMSAMGEVHDKEFQQYINKEVQQRTGLPITYAHMADVYNTDWSKIADDVANSMSKMTTIGSGDDPSFLERMGNNFIDEMRRVPENFPKITDNVLREIEKSPEAVMQLARDIAAEANRTPDNIAEIANNIARESARGGVNVYEEVVRTPENIAEISSNVYEEIIRTPGNVAEISSNVIDEVARGAEKVGDQLARTKWDELILKYGPDIANFIMRKYPNFDPSQDMPDFMLDDIEMNFANFNRPQKKGGMGLIATGLLGVAAIAYLAMDD
jgi:hypothetical protein